MKIQLLDVSAWLSTATFRSVLRTWLDSITAQLTAHSASKLSQIADSADPVFRRARHARAAKLETAKLILEDLLVQLDADENAAVEELDDDLTREFGKRPNRQATDTLSLERYPTPQPRATPEHLASILRLLKELDVDPFYLPAKADQ